MGWLLEPWGKFCLGDIVNLWLKNAFFSSLFTINLKIFSNHDGLYTFERKFNKHFGDKTLSSQLKCSSSYFLRWMDVCVGDVDFEKDVKDNRPVLVFNVCSGDKKVIAGNYSLNLYFQALIIEFHFVPLVLVQSLRKGRLEKVFVVVLVVILLELGGGQINSLGKNLTWMNWR